MEALRGREQGVKRFALASPRLCFCWPVKMSSRLIRRRGYRRLQTGPQDEGKARKYRQKPSKFLIHWVAVPQEKELNHAIPATQAGAKSEFSAKLCVAVSSLLLQLGWERSTNLFAWAPQYVFLTRTYLCASNLKVISNSTA